MMTSSVFSVNGNHVEQSMLGTVPATGTLIKLLVTLCSINNFFDRIIISVDISL